MRVNIWINRDNEYFWENLDNKSGWVNYMIEQYIDAAKKEKLFKEKYEKNEDPMVQDPSTEIEG